MDPRSPQGRPIQEQVRSHAPPLAQGYCLEFVSTAGDVVRQPREGGWRLAPFEPPHGVPEGRMRVLYTSREGVVLPPPDPANPMPTVTICFGLSPDETPPGPTANPRTTVSGPTPPTSLPAGLHPAAESEESMEREIFSQHIERNEYHNFKLRAETKTVECMYGIIQRMMAERHALLQSTLAAPRQLSQHCTQLVETMGEAMQSFHTVIGMQSTALQAVQNQMELALVPPAPPPPPDYVGLGKTLLSIIRDLGMKAMDARAERSSLPANKGLEPQEPAAADLDTKASEPSEPPRPAFSPKAVAQTTPERSAGTANEQAAESLRRALTRMGEVDIARAFAGPEQFADFLADMRRELEAGRTDAASRSTPARFTAKRAPGAVLRAAAAVGGSKTAQSTGGTRQPPLVPALSPVPSGTSRTAQGRPGPMFPRL